MIRVVPDPTDDPEVQRRLTGMGWRPGSDAPRITRLAAYGVVRRDDRLLLCRVAPDHLGAGRWTLPGGGLDFGEAPVDAVVRDVEEETGLIAAVNGRPEIHSDAGDWDMGGLVVPYHHVRFVYPVVVAGGNERIEVGGSSDAIGWFTATELATMARGDLVDRLLGLPASAPPEGERPST